MESLDSNSKRTEGGIESNDTYVLNTSDGNTIAIETDRVPVKQRLGLVDGIAFVVGAIIGSGIFISPKGALQNSGSVGMCLLIWVISGFMSFCMAMVYADFGTMMPRSGGDYTYIRVLIGSLPAFLITWVSTTLSTPGGMALQSLVFADYLCAPLFDSCGPPDSIRKTIAALTMITLALTNTISVRLVASVQGIFTVLKTMILIIISVGGFVYLFQGKTENFENSFEGTTTELASITLAIYKCMFAYSGYNNLNEIAEELISPRKNIPKAITISLTIVTVIYMATNVSYFTVLSKSEFLSVSAVAYAWGDKVLGAASIIIPIGVMCSVYGTCNSGVFTNVRVRFAAARAGHLPEVLSFLHHKTRIPVVALWLNTLWALVLLIPGDIDQLMNLTMFIGLASNLLTMAAYFRLRYLRRNKPRGEDEFRLPIAVPILATLITIFLTVTPFTRNPKIEFLYGVAFVAAGLIVYVPFVHFQVKLPGLDHVTTILQLLFDICPTVQEKDEL